MQLNDTASVLVIILAGVLTLFLLLASIAVYRFIQVLKQLQKISEKAEKIADSAEHIGEFFRHAAGPAAIAKLLAGIGETVLKSHKKRKDKDE